MGVEVKLPRFRGSYVHVWEPRPIKGTKKMVYSVLALYAPGADLSAAKKAVNEAAKLKWGDKAADILKHPKTKSPFNDQKELVDNDGELRPGATAGAIYLNLSSQLKPLILGPDVQEIADPRDAYSGAYYVAQVEFFAWEHETGGRGISVNLLGIQKVADGEALGSSPARATVADFEAVDTSASEASDLFK